MSHDGDAHGGDDDGDVFDLEKICGDPRKIWTATPRLRSPRRTWAWGRIRPSFEPDVCLRPLSTVIKIWVLIFCLISIEI